MSGEEVFEHKVKRLASPLLGIVVGLFLFEALTGAAVTFWGGFGAWLQYGVLLHTAAGLAFLAPFAVYAWTHFLRTRHSGWKSLLWIGYATFAAVFVSAATGLWAAWDAALAERVMSLIRSLHL